MLLPVLYEIPMLEHIEAPVVTFSITKKLNPDMLAC